MSARLFCVWLIDKRLPQMNEIKWKSVCVFFLNRIYSSWRQKKKTQWGIKNKLHLKVQMASDNENSFCLPACSVKFCRDNRRVFLYLHSVAEVSSSSDGHHGQKAGSGPDVQDDDSFASSLYSGHSGPDSQIVFLVLKGREIIQANIHTASSNTLLIGN